jgi:hypothetical protein
MSADELDSSAAAGATLDYGWLAEARAENEAPEHASDAINIVKARPALRRPLEL